jgi:hypothetical protein
MAIRSFICVLDGQHSCFRPISGQPRLTEVRSTTLRWAPKVRSRLASSWLRGCRPTLECGRRPPVVPREAAQLVVSSDGSGPESDAATGPTPRPLPSTILRLGPKLKRLSMRTRGRRNNCGSRSTRARMSASKMRRYLRPASTYDLPSVSRSATRPKRSANQRISAGDIGRWCRSTIWIATRRSLKNRSAARVSWNFLIPKIWTFMASGIKAVGVEGGGSGIYVPTPIIASPHHADLYPGRRSALWSNVRVEAQPARMPSSAIRACANEP